jgi:hypothetical protein
MYKLFVSMKRSMRDKISSGTSQEERWRGVRTVLYAVLVGCMVIFWSIGDATAETKRIKEYGMLISVESDGTVVIDKNGYAVASFASIVNSTGKKTTLKELQLPTKVYFEYDYTDKGPVIKRMKEIAQ